MTLTENLPGTADADALYDAFTLWTTGQASPCTRRRRKR